jgi:N-acetylmuramoyl-L-alanine amidase
MRVSDLPSPNFNARKRPVGALVLHYTGMETGEAAIARLRDPAASVSAHYVVKEDGAVLRLVAEDKRAWHAGLGVWRGETDMNSASIGVEIVNGGHDFGLPPFPDVQIAAVISLCRAILVRWDIPPAGVIGHSDLAPDRKTDPGERFPWRRLAQAGVGLFPDGPDGAGPDEDGARADLCAIGYGEAFALSDVLTAFQRRYRPQRVDGVLDAETAGLIRAVRRLHGV